MNPFDPHNPIVPVAKPGIVVTPKAATVFSSAQLDQILKDTLPADAKPGENVIVTAIDQNGAKVAANFKLREHWELRAAAEHEWSGDNRVGAKVVMRWVVILALLFPGLVRAQGLPTRGERRTAEVVSQVTLAGSVALDTWDSFHADNVKKALMFQGIRYGVGVAYVAVSKKFRHDPRPCIPLPEGCGLEDPDANKPTGHTVLSGLGVDWLGLFRPGGSKHFGLSLSLHLGTGAARYMSGKHSADAVVEGFAEAAAISMIRSR